MKQFYIILLSLVLVNTSLTADWKSALGKDHQELSNSYVKVLTDIKDVQKQCKRQIEAAHYYKSTMNANSIDDQKKLQKYIALVKYYCSSLAGCANCDREK